ncbi:hypothetical protein Taro_029030, partial [Colocasia esculenta]|nr:hypothetical protein [Colocasia esculenta]
MGGRAAVKEGKAAAPSHHHHHHRATSGSTVSTSHAPTSPNWPRHSPHPCSCLLPFAALLLLPLALQLFSSTTISSPCSPSPPPHPAMRALLLPPAVSFAAPANPAALPSLPGAPLSSLASPRSGSAARSLPVRAMQRASSLSPPSSLAAEEASPASMAGKWAQKTVVIPAQRRGCHLITSRVLREIEQDLSGFKCGLPHFFLQHTSASLTINENYDSDVQDDTETFLNRIVPEGQSAPWKHTLEESADSERSRPTLSRVRPWRPDSGGEHRPTHGTVGTGLLSRLRPTRPDSGRVWPDSGSGSAGADPATRPDSAILAPCGLLAVKQTAGPDDMPAHIKSSMFGCDLTIPITNGRLHMGTWQGIWLCEHRDHATPRKIVVTLNGRDAYKDLGTLLAQ